MKQLSHFLFAVAHSSFRDILTKILAVGQPFSDLPILYRKLDEFFSSKSFKNFEKDHIAFQQAIAAAIGVTNLLDYDGPEPLFELPKSLNGLHKIAHRW